MQTYINQLLEDIADAHRPEEQEALFPKSDEEKMEEFFEGMERFFNEEPRHPLSSHCGLRRELFPPAPMLNDAQICSVADAFNQMLQTWSISTDIPSALPPRKAYPLLIPLLDEHFHTEGFGRTTWSFCATEPRVCPYEEHCFCIGLEWLDELPEGEPDVYPDTRLMRRKRWEDDDFF
jgi:hypothetical protein